MDWRKRGLLFPFALILALLLSNVLTTVVFAKSVSDEKYSFLFIQNGKVVRSWEGLQSQTQKLKKDIQEVEQISRSSSHAKPSSSSSGVQPLIQAAYPCPDNWQYFMLQDDSANYFCFAYHGDLYVNFLHIIRVWTGNNNGNFEFITSYGEHHYVPGNGYQLCAWDTVSPSDVIPGATIFYDVTKIGIAYSNDPCQYW